MQRSADECRVIQSSVWRCMPGCQIYAIYDDVCMAIYGMCMGCQIYAIYDDICMAIYGMCMECQIYARECQGVTTEECRAMRHSDGWGA